MWLPKRAWHASGVSGVASELPKRHNGRKGYRKVPREDVQPLLEKLALETCQPLTAGRGRKRGWRPGGGEPEAAPPGALARCCLRPAGPLVGSLIPWHSQCDGQCRLNGFLAVDFHLHSEFTFRLMDIVPHPSLASL
jgi:hypothetical protein